MKIIDLVYFSNMEISSPKKLLPFTNRRSGCKNYFKNKAEVIWVKYGNFSKIIRYSGIVCAFFRGTKQFWQIPFKTHDYIKKQLPDVVFVNGLVFPLQTFY